MFLLFPGHRQLAGKSADGQIGWRATLSNGIHDARRQIGKWRQEAHVAFGELSFFAMCSNEESDSAIISSSQLRERTMAVSKVSRVWSVIVPDAAGEYARPLFGLVEGVKRTFIEVGTSSHSVRSCKSMTI